jgi:hypothetical protein
LPAVQRRQATHPCNQDRENIRNLLEDKKTGKSYGSGINVPSKKVDKSETKNRPPYKNYGKISHNMRTHCDCTVYFYYKYTKKMQGEV